MPVYTIPDRIRSADKLPSMPGVAMEVLELAKNEEDVGLSDFAQVICRDPVLAAKLLQLANSAAYNSGEPVSNLDQAMSKLGIRTVQSMAISFSLAAAMPNTELATAFHLDAYWHRSILTAVAARSLARMTGRCSEEDAFLAGLLCNLGELILGACLPEEFDRITDVAQGGTPSLDEEQAILGFNRADVGGGLLEEWGLPPAIHMAVAFKDRFHELPTDVDEETRKLAEVAHIASLTVEVISGESRATALVRLATEVARMGIPPVQLNTFLLDIEHDLRETTDLMELAVGHGPSHRDVLVGAREEIMAFLQGGGTTMSSRKERRAVQAGPSLPRPEGEGQLHERTGVATRVFLDQVMSDELTALKQGTRIYSLGLLRIQLDDFEGRVASRGAEFAEEVESRVGQLLAHTLRREDLPAYADRGSFTVLVSRTSPRGLAGMAARVQGLIQSLAISDGDEQVELSASLGAACAVRCDTQAEGLDLWLSASLQLEKARARGGGAAQVCEQLRLAAA